MTKKYNKPVKKEKPPMKPLDKAMSILRRLHLKGEITTLTEQRFLINAPHEYIYVAFRIPKRDVKIPKTSVKKREIFDKTNIIREVLD